MIRWALVFVCTIAFASSAIADDASGAVSREAMKKLSFLAGKWAGEATVQTGKDQVKTIKQTEDIQFRLGGVVLLIEGTGRGKFPDSDKEGILFNALATIGYDADAQKYHMRAHVMEGHAVDPELIVKDGCLVWQFTPPKSKVQVRYTITVTGDIWDEIGEMSFDGKTWNKTMSMTLKRVNE